MHVLQKGLADGMMEVITECCEENGNWINKYDNYLDTFIDIHLSDVYI